MRFRRLVPAVFAAAAALVATALPVAAITNGTRDSAEEPRYPYVGLMIAEVGGAPAWRCTGTLIDPDVFLTAGHCTFGADNVKIWFDVEPPQPGPEDDRLDFYPFGGFDAEGTPLDHPDYEDARFFLADLGVVVLDAPIEGDLLESLGDLPSLPQQDQLDSLRPNRRTTFTAVGYGLQRAFPGPASWKTEADRVRMIAEPQLLQINNRFTGPTSILLSNNANTGGTCFGDSGGPNFIGSSDVIAGVTSFGLNPTCAGTGGVFRIDREFELSWLNWVIDDPTRAVNEQYPG